MSATQSFVAGLRSFLRFCFIEGLVEAVEPEGGFYTAQTDTGMDLPAMRSQHSSTATTKGFLRPIKRLMDELDELAATAGGWHAQIPAADKTGWMEPKRPPAR